MKARRYLWSRRRFLQGASLGSLVYCGPLWNGTAKGMTGWQDQVLSLRPSDTSLAQSCILDDVQLRFRLALENIEHANTAEEARAAKSRLRASLEHSLGLHQFPWPPNLQSHRTGTLQQDGFRIEKIVYQTFPGSLVPALLYVPNDLKEPAPSIILYIGHWWPDSKAGPDHQSLCINLARMGFVVLTWDPFGQGESGVSSRDHRRVEALLVGISEQGYAEYETQCALSYLTSRPEVDPQRIGMTGASGGGYNTWVTAVLDDRIKIAVPVVGTSEFYEQIWSTRFLAWGNCVDSCHHVAGLVRYANNHEFLACVAPRPLCMIAAHDDHDFPADGVLKIYEYGRNLYKSFGAPEKITAFVDAQAGHGYQVKKREVAYGWFSRWLLNKGAGEPMPEPPTTIVPPDAPELRCFPVGRNQSSGPGMIRVATSVIEKLSAPVPPSDLDVVFGKLPSLPSVPTYSQHSSTAKGVQRLEFASENGIKVPAFLVKPDLETPKGLIIGVDDHGKEALVQDEFIQLAINSGWALCGLDVRGIGELAVDRIRWVACASLLMNENFVWRQGWDLRCARHYFQAASPATLKPVVLYGRGDNSALAVSYALVQEPKTMEVRGFLLRDGFLSFRQFVDRPQSIASSYRLRPDMRDALTGFDHEIPYEYFVFDVLRWLDLPRLLESAGVSGLVVNPIDGDWNHMSQSAARQLLPAAIRLTCESRPYETMLHFLSEVAEHNLSIITK